MKDEQYLISADVSIFDLTRSGNCASVLKEFETVDGMYTNRRPLLFHYILLILKRI